MARICWGGSEGRSAICPQSQLQAEIAICIGTPAHKPTSSKSPALTAPVKLVMVTEWRHDPHQTLASSSFFLSAGMAAHSLAAGSVNFGIDSMLMGGKFRSSGGLNPFDASNSQHPLTEIVNEDWNELSNVCGVVVFPHLLQPLTCRLILEH